MTEREELQELRESLARLDEHHQRIAELQHELAHTKSQLASLLLQMKGEAPTIPAWDGAPNSLGAKNGTISDL